MSIKEKLMEKELMEMRNEIRIKKYLEMDHEVLAHTMAYIERIHNIELGLSLNDSYDQIRHDVLSDEIITMECFCMIFNMAYANESRGEQNA